MASTVYDAVLGALTLRQVVSSNYNGNNQVIVGRQSGDPAPSEYFGGVSEPMASFDSADIAGILAAISVSAGLYVSGGTITIPWNRRNNGGTFAGTMSHTRLNATHGLIIPTQFSANQDDEAAICSLDVHFLSSDGTTAPVTASIDQTLAAQAFNAQYGMGGGSVNGVAIPQLQGIVVNPGIQVEKFRKDGFNFSTEISITNQEPFIDFVFNDLEALNTAGPLFTVMTAAVAYFRKRSGVSWVSDVTAEHVKFSFADGITSTETIQASGVNRGQATLRCYGEALTASGASAIT